MAGLSVHAYAPTSPTASSMMWSRSCPAAASPCRRTALARSCSVYMCSRPASTSPQAYPPQQQYPMPSPAYPQQPQQQYAPPPPPPPPAYPQQQYAPPPPAYSQQAVPPPGPRPRIVPPPPYIKNRNAPPSREELDRQAKLWEDFFNNPMDWWDNRQDKRNPRFPDFRHKASKEGLWLESRSKPAWVDKRLRLLDTEKVFVATCEGEDLDKALDKAIDTLHSVGPDFASFSDNGHRILFRLCNTIQTLPAAKRIFECLSQYGLETHKTIGEYMVSSFNFCGGHAEAIQLFYNLKERTAFSYTIAVASYTETGKAVEAVKLYETMQNEGIEPDEYTYVGLIKACAFAADLETGRKLHEATRGKWYESHVYVGNALIGLYGKNLHTTEAEDVFKSLPERDTVSWNSMLLSYIEKADAMKTMCLLRQMLQEGVELQPWTVVIALESTSLLADSDVVVVDGASNKVIALEIGQAFHAMAMKSKKFDKNAFIPSSLLSMYAKCGKYQEAEHVFSSSQNQNVVLWNAMASVYVEQSQGEKALLLYKKMLEDGVEPDIRSFVVALEACQFIQENNEAARREGKSDKEVFLELHQSLIADAQKKGFDIDALSNATCA